MLDSNSTYRQNKLAIGVAIFVVLVFFLPYILLGENAYIRIHDTLEGEWVWISNLLRLNLAVDTNPETIVPNVFNGIPRYMFPSGFNLNFFLVNVFGSFWGYFVSSVILRLTAFFGTYFLVKNYFIKDEAHRYIAIYAGLIFCMIPFFIPFGITVAGQPLLLMAFLNIYYTKSNYWEYAFILLLPFYSSIVWAAPFYNLGLVVLLLVLFKKEGKLPWKYIVMLGLMNLVYIGANYHTLVYSTLFADVISHRVEYNPLIEWNASIPEHLGETLYIFFIGHYHVGMFVALPIFIFALMHWRNRSIKILVFTILGISLLNGFYFFLIPVLGTIHPLLLSFVIKRVNVLLPFLWLLVLIVSLKTHLVQPKMQKLGIFLMLNLVVIGFFTNDEVLNTYRNILGAQKKPSYKQFFAEDLYEEVYATIGQEKSTFNVGHIGLSPSISQYNQFQTIDGIQSLYPLKHKHIMAEVMQGEFEKDQDITNYFLAWGNRCYLYSAELGHDHEDFMIDKDYNDFVYDLDLNYKLLKDQNVSHIISALPIKQSHNGLDLVERFKNDDSIWQLHLYRLK